MFDLNKKTDYGLEFLTSLAKNFQKGPLSLKEITKEKNLPLKYLEQIANSLRDYGLVEAKEGKGGGYFLVKNPKDISLAEVIEAIDGDSGSTACLSCSKASGCGQKALWLEVNKNISKTMRHKSLADLAKKG